MASKHVAGFLSLLCATIQVTEIYVLEFSALGKPESVQAFGYVYCNILFLDIKSPSLDPRPFLTVFS